MMTLLIRLDSYITAFPIVIRSCLPFKDVLQNSKIALLLAIPDLLHDLRHLSHPALGQGIINSTEPHRSMTVKQWYGRQHNSFCPSYSPSISWELLTSLRKKKNMMKLLQPNTNVIYMQNDLANQKSSILAGGSFRRTIEIITMLVGLINKENCINYSY